MLDMNIENATDQELVSAELDGLELVVKSKTQSVGTAVAEPSVDCQTFNIRQITNFDLRHETDDGFVYAYVGLVNPARRPAFSVRAVDRKFLGRINNDHKLDTVRRTFTMVGVPIIEL